MSMDGYYAEEKLHDAVFILAKGRGTLRERLDDAYVSSLMRLRSDKHFPWPDLRQSFEDLLRDVAPMGNPLVALSVWPEEDLQRIAEGIVDLSYRVSRKMAAGHGTAGDS